MKDLESRRLPVILVIEDSLPDFESVLRAFRKLGMKNPVSHCMSGEAALDFLYRRNEYADPAKSPRPDVILLDLNLPGTDGRDVLKEIKKDPDLRSIPVVVLTTSASYKDIHECYKAGANSYMVKPVDWTDLCAALEKFKAYCLDTAMLPNGGRLNS